MSKRSRIIAVASGLALLAAFSIAGYQLGKGIGELRGERQTQAQNYAEHTSDQIQSACIGLDTVAQTECVERIVKASNEDQRSEYDLIAQTEMSTWAFWMLWATLVMAAITAVGVYFVWRTLLATQDMAKDTTRIGEAQVQAHLMPTDAKATLMTQESDSIVYGYYKIELGVKNVGVTPAYRISAVGEVFECKTKGERFHAQPSDLGHNQDCYLSLHCPISSDVYDTCKNECRVSIYISFDTVFTRGAGQNRRERIRFDYRVERNQSGGHNIRRL